MKNKNNYLHIKSMSQLRIERARLNSNITMKEALFEFQYANLKESLKIGNLISSFIANLATAIPIITQAISLFKELYNKIIEKLRPEKQDDSKF